MIQKYCDDWKNYYNWKILWWLKKIVMIEKNCNDWKKLWWLKKLLWLKNIVMIQTYCDDSKILWWFKNIVMIEKIAIIEKYCDDWKQLWWFKNIVLIQNYCDNGIYSSIIIQSIKAVSFFLFFLRQGSTRTKSLKSTKRKETTFNQMFFICKKSIYQQTNLPLRCFFCFFKCIRDCFFCLLDT